MRCRNGMVLVGLLLAVGGAAAFEVRGVLRKVDAGNNTMVVNAGQQERTVRIAKDATFLDEKGQPLAEGIRSKELKEGTAVTLTIERDGNQPVIHAVQLGGKGGNQVPEKSQGGKASVGFKPLSEMTAEDRYKGEDGGLYGGGKNAPPAGHLAASRVEAGKIVPRDADGEPSARGTIGFASISMSNATQVFSMFKKMADADSEKSPRVTVVDCAQGGQAMAEWVSPKASAWIEADRRLKAAGVSAKQVQVVWIKLANKGPSGDLAEHGKKLEKDTLAVIQNAKTRFPNLRIAYLDSRTYAGWSTGRLNPEPYAYESAFVVRWLIQDQIKGAPALNFDAARGAVKSPVLLWGAYLGTDGTTPRKSDGLVWERSDVANDGVHPSESGRRKAAEQLLSFFKKDETAKAWFVGR
ncbi:MAG: hypothetical protein U0744_00200 [Gemmataceae bacterium]